MMDASKPDRDRRIDVYEVYGLDRHVVTGGLHSWKPLKRKPHLFLLFITQSRGKLSDTARRVSSCELQRIVHPGVIHRCKKTTWRYPGCAWRASNMHLVSSIPSPPVFVIVKRNCGTLPVRVGISCSQRVLTSLIDLIYLMRFNLFPSSHWSWSWSWSWSRNWNWSSGDLSRVPYWS